MPCQTLEWAKETVSALMASPVPGVEVATMGGTLLLVAVAEMGDKSQLVCMALASRHRHWPVFWGAATAFSLLNLMGVWVGAAVTHLVPKAYLAGTVSLLFLGFGIHALLDTAEAAERIQERRGHGVFFTTFLMIFLAELGDKTQIAVAGLAASSPPASVWIGATAALMTTTGLAIWAGKALFRRVPFRWVGRLAGCLFLGFGGLAAYKAVLLLQP